MNRIIALKIATSSEKMMKEKDERYYFLNLPLACTPPFRCFSQNGDFRANVPFSVDHEFGAHDHVRRIHHRVCVSFISLYMYAFSLVECMFNDLNVRELMSLY